MPAPRALMKGFEKVVATAKPDPSKRLTISDPDTRGLFLRIMPSGHKSYTIVARNPAGKQVWAVVGNCDDITLEDARTKAREGVKRIKAGEVPFPKAEPTAAPDTFQDVHDNFITRHVEKKALRSAAETKRIFNVYVLPKWGQRAFTSIKRSDVAKLLDEIEDNNGPVMADRTLAALSKMFNWYATRDDDYVSPVVKGMRRAGNRARERILSDDEIRLIWKAADADGSRFGAFLKMCLLTAQRRAKVAAMNRNDISKCGVWTIPAEAREKASAGELTLSPAALAIIEAQPKVEGNPHVFPGRDKKPMHPGDKLKKDFSAAMQKRNGGKAVADWTIHDLRRTAKSLMARAGVLPHISERVLGHAIAGVEGVYDRHSYAEEKAEALRKLAGLVELIVNPPAGNVTRLERKAS